MTKTYKVVDEAGLHARPATLLVREASLFKEDIFIIYKGKRLSLKSIMLVMSLGISQNSEFAIEVNEGDEEAILKALEKVLVEHKII